MTYVCTFNTLTVCTFNNFVFLLIIDRFSFSGTGFIIPPKMVEAKLTKYFSRLQPFLFLSCTNYRIDQDNTN